MSWRHIIINGNNLAGGLTKPNVDVTKAPDGNVMAYEDKKVSNPEH